MMSYALWPKSLERVLDVTHWKVAELISNNCFYTEYKIILTEVTIKAMSFQVTFVLNLDSYSWILIYSNVAWFFKQTVVTEACLICWVGSCVINSFFYILFFGIHITISSCNFCFIFGAWVPLSFSNFLVLGLSLPNSIRKIRLS